MLKLNLGSGCQLITGWHNLDINGGNVTCDLRQSLPYPNQSVSFIYSEHFMEHLDEVDGFNLMKECYRVMISGGRLRFSCPDLRQFVEAYLNWDKETQSDKVHFTNGVNYLNYAMLGESRSDIKYLSAMNHSQDHGHRYHYDENEMRRKLTAAGFRDVIRCTWNQSQSPELANLETRSSRDLIVEATKHS